MQRPRRYIVEAALLPEIFLKVSDAKEYLRTGAARSVAQAAAMAGVSRSAFYKYRDAITPFRDMRRDQIVNMSILTRDQPGALSAVLAIFAGSGANILTINQSIPVDGVGVVTLSVNPGSESFSLDALQAGLEASPMVIRTELLSGF